MSVQYDRQTLIEGNRLRAQASERPTTFAEYNGAVDAVPSAGGMQLNNQTRFAGQVGARALELMNPAAAQQTEQWMGMFSQSVPGYQFNEAKMMQAQAAAQQQVDPAEKKEF